MALALGVSSTNKHAADSHHTALFGYGDFHFLVLVVKSGTRPSSGVVLVPVSQIESL